MPTKDVSTSQGLHQEKAKSIEDSVTRSTINNKQQQLQQNVSNQKTLAGIVIGSSFLGTIVLISPFLLMQLRSPLPFMSTPRRKVLAALEEIASRKEGSSRSRWINETSTSTSAMQQSSNQSTSIASTSLSKKKTLRYYDLGSGDGETVLAAASVGWCSTGVELNSTLYILSALRRSFLFSPPPVRKFSNFVWGDMWSQKIGDADAVMVFGVRPLMPRVAEKIGRECRPGTFVMSYRFRIPLLGDLGVGERKILRHGDGNRVEEGASMLDANMIYDVEEMRIYQLRGDDQEQPENDMNHRLRTNHA